MLRDTPCAKFYLEEKGDFDGAIADASGRSGSDHRKDFCPLTVPRPFVLQTGDFDRAIADNTEAANKRRHSPYYRLSGLSYMGKKADCQPSHCGLQRGGRLDRSSPMHAPASSLFMSGDVDRGIAAFNEEIQLAPKNWRLFGSANSAQLSAGALPRPARSQSGE